MLKKSGLSHQEYEHLKLEKKKGANKIDWHGHHLVFDIVLHPRKLTYPPKDYFNRKYIFQTWIFRGPGSIVSMSFCWLSGH